jgi:hypothetical protein
MAARMHWAPSMLSRLETGKRSSTSMEIVKYTTLCGALGHEQDVLVRLANQPDDHRLELHNGKIPDELHSVSFHESTATAIESFDLVYLPAIVQTEEYARGVFETARLLDPAVIDGLVRVRMARRDVLTRTEPARCVLYVHENALRLSIGGPQVMHEQALHLLFASSRPQCIIRVVPISAGAAGVTNGSFSVFDYPDRPPLIYVEHRATSEFLESKREIDTCRETLTRIANSALTEPESRNFIVELASDYEVDVIARREHAAT